tara:strand:- start:3582 stop:4370 length:789 start_codon:yes stop_codon:yes gene_type:complete
MNFIQPSIDPVILSLGIIDIRWYSLAYIIGILFGVSLIKKLNQFKGNLISNTVIDSFLIWAVIGIIIGGRAGYVLFYQTKLFLNNPFYIFEIWNGGMSFHGGLLGVIISIYFFSSFKKISFLYLSDLVSVVAPIGLFLGRIANFINTELIGRPTDFYISVIYPSIDNIPRHPSQLYEAFFEGLILFIILISYFIISKQKKNFGMLSGIFLLNYGIFRFFIEYLREPDSHLGYILNIITMGQLLCLPLLFFGLLLIYYNAKKN